MAKTIKDSDLISVFQKMLRGHWSYEKGAAREGCVDCSGAFVYAFGKFGKSIDHGSNSIARKYISGELLPITQARPGYAAFKRRQWEPTEAGNRWYGTQPGDIHHIGLVDSDGESVLNAKGTNYGFCSDPLSKWDYVAPLKGVDYEVVKEMETLYQATVNTSEGKLNVRKAADQSSKVVDKLPKGTVVNVVEEGSGWLHVQKGNIDGWCDSTFLKKVEDEETEDESEQEEASGDVWTVLINDEDGGTIRLGGSWRVADD